MERVIYNLISNALRFGKKGGHVDISLTQNRNRLILRIRDDGQGMDKDMLHHLFEKYRLFSINDTSPGLGLPISVSYVEQHGGTIFVESQKGKGTLFY